MYLANNRIKFIANQYNTLIGYLSSYEQFDDIMKNNIQSCEINLNSIA